ncbi:hypothetical protein N7462_006449 [Penicillium macrosclerotiorum]|uniref:uncharacterized protein n=1 Tax=Penicillium macrosclerotiorum TaxID=303699 RepID=UPI0025493EAC|nr:uncharacterized protein N7462_006449 [Penicillium macrosclerotiorum]KAJ5683284.1 hypothetical protein N7462_006449 [Penicillium macrosclerotiorum]
MASTRRSGRVKGPRTVYIEDPFESAGISDNSGSEKPSLTAKKKGKRRQRDDSSSDEEFVAPASEEENDDRPEGGDDSEAADEEFGTIHDDVEAMDVDRPKVTPKRKPKRASRARGTKTENGGTTPLPFWQAKTAADETHSRGVVDAKEHVSKVMHYMTTFGSDDRDLLSAVYGRDRWARGVDSCFPTRFSLDESKSGPDYEYGPTHGVAPGDMEKERTSGWDWYYDKDIGGRFRKRQRVDPKLKEADARRKYLPTPRKEKYTAFIGPLDNQQPVHLGHHEVYNYGDAWPEAKVQRSDGAGSKAREGWLMNFGQKIQCVAWAPNQDSLSQYLAVVTPITNEQKKKFDSPENDHPSAFRPLPSYPCALQIWEFQGKKAGKITDTLDMSKKPRLRLTICTDWGDIRRISWCPMPREKREEDDKDGSKNLGLIAGIWGDGKVRVLDIKLGRSEKPEFVKFDSPVFEATSSSPSNVCTCLTWLSPNDIAAGISDGFVGIWSILPSSEPTLKPWFYRPIHASFVLSITSAYPDNPHLVSTIAMDGETKLWSILDPQIETTSAGRMRQAALHVSYSPLLHCIFSSDENDYCRMLPIRRFYGTTFCGQVPSTVTSLAPCSSWHPCVLYGGAGGQVVGSNPVRRLLYAKEQHWQQTWFSHEWVQGTDPHGPGISRFYDGFRAETQSLARNLTGEKRPVLGSSLTTVHDESTHVAALGWNPNHSNAAWASAGLGCGLLRVEDLAI